MEKTKVTSEALRRMEMGETVTFDLPDADGKSYDMYALPLKFIYGWLATINPGKVSGEARDAVTRYRRECYDVLYEHSTGSMRRTIETK